MARMRTEMRIMSELEKAKKISKEELKKLVIVKRWTFNKAIENLEETGLIEVTTEENKTYFTIIDRLEQINDVEGTTCKP